MDRAYDIVIVGAGMAGASLAAALVSRARDAAQDMPSILLIEAEKLPGYHTTGRSAAFWMESYGGAGVQPLTSASGPVLRALGVLRRRQAITLARADQIVVIDSFIDAFKRAQVDIRRIDRATIETMVPGIGAQWVAGALEPECCDIDVAALHQHYLTVARQGGVVLACDAGLIAARRQGDQWALTLTNGQTTQAGVLVNAAGAWADDVARLAGAAPIGIQPYRRTMVQARVAPVVGDDLPLVLDLDGSFYLKPESGRLWLTPHDETPSAPCDAAPEEIDVATAIARIEAAGDWRITHVEHKWAGLRSFAPDRLPVLGWDAARGGGVPGLFWCAGQGGFGIQTAPAAADLAARLLRGEGQGAIPAKPYDPGRFG
ncbi:FAD-dependent oxidoreductase [Novosphingobium sp. FSY-8]|uniref:FAD-dependent oxidoreductase n=1 Tax=Novosphingobium ovatum TaxID=1908523 RepID=A0ABW9XE65_9SPHN|nr:FAD-dependent oxidoreductase [Novosphingobium ovatum]NBC36802.1 FAD-dependent oxidoreductase [Novosphingobium ovatum]